MKRNKRKPPEMPRWFWTGSDNCWMCKNKNGCNRCRYVLKERRKLLGYKGEKDYD